jgi:hypothetical protein
MKIDWSGFRTFKDVRGKEYKRFYKLDTLAQGTERLLQTRNRFIIPAIQSVLGRDSITALSFELMRESAYQLVFRIRAMNSHKQRANFAFVVAKNREECSKWLEMEYGNLTLLHERMPRYIPKPLAQGIVYLPDRYRRDSQGREIQAYITEWTPALELWGIHRNGQIMLLGEKRHTLTKKETEYLRGQLVELMARSYDVVKRESMSFPDLKSGEILVKRSSRGALSLKVAGCRRLMFRVTPAKLIDRLLGAILQGGDTQLSLAPADPHDFYDALVAAQGEEQVQLWLRQYLKSMASGRNPVCSEPYLAALEELVNT